MQRQRRTPGPRLGRLQRTATALLLGAAVLAPAGVAAGDSGSRHRSYPVDAADNAVLVWNANAADAAVAVGLAPLNNPLDESRMYAMTQIAVHDALNAIDPRSKPYSYSARAPRDSSAEAAVAAAARGVLVSALAGLPAPFVDGSAPAIAGVELDYAEALAALPADGSTEAGVAVGQAAAAAILADRADDGSDTPRFVVDYPQGTAPGEWRFTPGAALAFAPGWGDVEPFALRDSSRYRSGRPYDVESRRYAADLEEVRRLGGDGVTTPTLRTPEQTQVAHFWWESSPMMWNRIARTVSVDREIDLWEQARLFALLNVSLADGYIASFDTKYSDPFWRPVTAIREAGSDGNPRTTADPTWTPLEATPPIPEYDSAHAVEGGAAAAVLAGFFGTDRIEFSACSLTLPAGGTCTDTDPVLRHYDSFSQAARENAESRIYIGFHFRYAVETGTRHGERIGASVVRRLFEPERGHGHR